MININYSSTYSFQKPTSEEKYNINVYNTNMDLIDSALNRIENNLNAEIDHALSSEQDILETISANKPVWDDKYTKNEIDNKFSALETNIDWKESVESFDDIAIAYPDPDDGWTVNVNDTDITYRFNGEEWVSISANAIPKVTNDVDGLLSKEDYANAANHISDAIRHITSDERDNWNIAKEHAESDHARTDATKVEKSDTNGNIKINGIEVNVYTSSEETNPQGNSGIYYSDTEPLILIEGMTWIGNEEDSGEEGE